MQRALINNLNGTVCVFDQGGTGFHPVAGIVVGDLSELANRRAMDMTAKDCIDGVLLGIPGYCRLEFPNETDRIFDRLLDVGAERPITQPKASPHKVD